MEHSPKNDDGCQEAARNVSMEKKKMKLLVVAVKNERKQHFLTNLICK